MMARRFTCVVALMFVVVGLGISSTAFAQEGVEDAIDECDPRVLIVDAQENGTQILAEITVGESTATTDILAAPADYEGQLVQVEGLIVAVCDNAGCWAEMREEGGNSIRIKVTDGAVDFRMASVLGHYMVAQGIFQEAGPHGAQVFIMDHGALVGTTECVF